MRRWYPVLATLVLSATTLPCIAQDYPSRPIRAIASQGPGGLSDIFMRALGDEMGPLLGGTVVVEDRTGGAGSIGARACGEAPPDGYTICILPTEPIVINPIICPNTGFDPKKSLVPITRAFYLTQVLAVNASLNVKSFAELAAAAKAKPKTLSYMAPSLSKVAFMEDFNKKHGTDFVRVPFKGGGDAVNSMLSGTTACANRKIDFTLTAIRRSNSASSTSSIGRRTWLMPALLTRMSTAPKASTVACTAASTSARRETSQRTATAWLLIEAATSRAARSLRSAIAMRAPSRAKVSAIPLPKPDAPPVTSATRLSRRMLVCFPARDCGRSHRT
jgi:hypothetical protein